VQEPAKLEIRLFLHSYDLLAERCHSFSDSVAEALAYSIN